MGGVMEVYAIAPDGCAPYLTPGEKYEILRFDSDGDFYIFDDEGEELLCLRHNCSHAGRENWILKPRRIGLVIKEKRIIAGMTQNNLFTAAFPDSDNPSGRAYISKIESGKQNPSLNSFLAIAKALNVPASNILKEAGL